MSSSSSGVFGGLLVVVVVLGSGCGTPFEAGGGAGGMASSSGVGGATTTASSSTSTGSGSGGATSGGTGGGAGGMAATPTSCTVLAHDLSDQPVADLPVAVNDASGAVVSMTKTGPDGKALVSVPPGGMVTAFDVEGTTANATSAVAPPNGSTFLARAMRNEMMLPPPGKQTSYHIVATSAPPGTADFVVVSSCGDDTFTPAQMTLIIWAGCAGAPTENLVMIARDASGAPLGWAAANKATLPGKDGGYVYLSPTIPNFEKFDASMTSIPAGVADASVTIYPNGLGGLRFPVVNSASNAATSLFAHATVPTGFTTGLGVAETVMYVDANAHQTMSYVQRVRTYDVWGGAESFDPSTFAVVTLDTLDVSDATHPRASWTAGPGGRGDMGYLSVAWSSPGGAWAYWQVVFPTDIATTLRLPDVPAGLESFAAKPSSKMAAWSVFYYDNEDVSSYAEILGAWPVRTSGHGFLMAQAQTSL